MSGSNWLFVTAAYVITWITVIGYLARLITLVHRAGESLAHSSAEEKENIL